MKDPDKPLLLWLIIFSKILGLFLIPVGLMLTTTDLFFAGQENPELIEDFRWAVFRNRFTSPRGLAFLGMAGVALLPTLVGVWLIKMPNLKMWLEPDIKVRDEEIG